MHLCVAMEMKQYGLCIVELYVTAIINVCSL